MKLEVDKVFKKKSDNWKHDVSVFWQLSIPYKWRLLAAILCGLALSGISGAIAWLVKPAMDIIFIEKAVGFLFILPIGVLALFMLRGIFTYLTNYLMSSIGAKVAKSLRQNIYDKILALSLSFYGKTSSGSVISRSLNDVEILNLTMAHTTKDFFVAGSTVIVLAVVAIARKWELALLSFIVLPLIVFGIGKFGVIMKKTSMKTRHLISKVTAILHESLYGMKIIKAFTMEREMAKRNEDALADHYRNTMREVRIKEASSLTAEALGGVGIAVILFYGGNLVISGEISHGSFFSFIVAILMMYTPLKRLSRVNSNFQQGRNVIERIRDIIIVEPEKTGGTEKEIKGHIVFDNVSFKYPSADNFALKDINLEIKPTEIIALVGHSGAGKSTFVDIVSGFWYPTNGHAYIDGVATDKLSIKSLRRHLGIVTQDIVLFNDTIKANIFFGRHGATDNEVIEAAKAAYAHEFIMELHDSYETKIGERGVNLSGGQKQRITIARAILRNPSVLILDEATASLDIESEQKVQMAMERLMEGRTTIVIAHRFSTIKKASKIIIMDRGRIVQQGSHDELLLQGGIYQELYNTQFADSSEIRRGGKDSLS